jgi:L-lactate dehydrogenase complex protein LldG
MSKSLTAEEHMLQTFVRKAGQASAVVEFRPDMDSVLDYALDICLKKDSRDVLVSEDSSQSSPAGEKIIAAPGLEDKFVHRLKEMCVSNAVRLVTSGLNHYPGGIDLGLTHADWGIAETGTLVVNTDSEDKRLAGMLSEIHVNILPESRIVADSFDLENQLGKRFASAPAYTSFITGPSRTADIERVLTLGVHGPLQLHILILRGA